jgi:riboflavin synthase
MFTGIAEGKGIIASLERDDDIVRITVNHSLDNNDISINDSICCSGICLTVVKQNKSSFQVEMVPETIERSTAKYWNEGTIINLERAMLPTTRMGGHYLQGHVDTVVQIKDIQHFENSAIFNISVDQGMMKYIVEKGYVGLDGLSLTVAKINNNDFDIALIPHTLKITNFGTKSISDSLNLEIDIVAKYVENFSKPHTKNV